MATRIFREGGIIPASGVATVDLTLVPAGLYAEETRRFLWENGSRICDSHIGCNPVSSELNTAKESRVCAGRAAVKWFPAKENQGLSMKKFSQKALPVLCLFDRLPAP